MAKLKSRKNARAKPRAPKAPKAHVVKRRGHTEPYDPRKIYASVYSACRSCHMGESESEAMGSRISLRMNFWVIPKKSVTSKQIAKEVHRLLKIQNPDAAFMYITHLDVN